MWCILARLLVKVTLVHFMYFSMFIFNELAFSIYSSNQCPHISYLMSCWMHNVCIVELVFHVGEKKQGVSDCQLYQLYSYIAPVVYFISQQHRGSYADNFGRVYTISIKVYAYLYHYLLLHSSTVLVHFQKPNRYIITISYHTLAIWILFGWWNKLIDTWKVLNCGSTN